MRDDLTEIGLVIDKSGSMWSKGQDVIGGFNKFLAEQKALPGHANLTMVQFDTNYTMVHSGVDIQQVPELNEHTYIPGGLTALLDAVARAVSDIGQRLANMPEDGRANKVIIVVMTDGEENSSREQTKEGLKKIIEHQRDAYKWEFIFLGQDIDAFGEAGSIGVGVHGTAQSSSPKQSFAMSSMAIGCLRTTGDIGKAWKEEKDPEQS